ncbi:MAG: AAA family ATPase [Gammaproteobacteria bacterium]
MQSIMFMNAKGGSGKSTLATNLAAYYASGGASVTLADFDTQGSCIDWLAARSVERPLIRGVHAATKSVKVPPRTDYVIMDAPGAVHGRAVGRLVKKVDTLVIPVSPSPVDIRATAKFIEELLLVRRVSREQTRVGVVANRVKREDETFGALQRFLDRLHIPMVATFMDRDCYVRAAGIGLSVFEMEGAEARDEVNRWQSLLRWVAGKPVVEKSDMDGLEVSMVR